VHAPLVDDEEATLEQLNRLCGAKHDVFKGAMIPRRCLHVEPLEEKTTNDREIGKVEISKSSIVKSKILTHFDVTPTP
jgi:hypothetical protein